MIEKVKQSLLPIGSGVFLLAIDAVTKWIANATLPVDTTVNTGLSFWKWRLTYNTGYHYLFGEIAHFRVVQTIGMIAVLVLVGVMVKQRSELDTADPNRKLFGVYIALLIGAMGNPLETLIFGRVTDYFIFTPLPWPSNVADQYINLAIYVFLPIWLYISYREWRQEKKAEKPSDPAPPQAEES